MATHLCGNWGIASYAKMMLVYANLFTRLHRTNVTTAFCVINDETLLLSEEYINIFFVCKNIGFIVSPYARTKQTHKISYVQYSLRSFRLLLYLHHIFSFLQMTYSRFFSLSLLPSPEATKSVYNRALTYFIACIQTAESLSRLVFGPLTYSHMRIMC